MSERDERLARAGDYVLGLMEDAARAAAEEALKTDPAFREAVRRLAVSMHALDSAAPPEAVPPDLWRRIDQQIGETLQLRIGSANDAPQSATVVPLKPSPSARPIWRPLLMAASLLATLGVGYLLGLQSNVQRPVVVVVLQTPAQTPGAVFEAFADNSVRIVPLEDFTVPQGKIMQVWTLYDKSVGPVSLGTLPKAEVAMLKAAAMPVPVADQLYEITLEDAPGSPTGKPTGPIVVKGFAKLPAGK